MNPNTFPKPFEGSIDPGCDLAHELFRDHNGHCFLRSAEDGETEREFSTKKGVAEQRDWSDLKLLAQIFVVESEGAGGKEGDSSDWSQTVMQRIDDIGQGDVTEDGGMVEYKCLDDALDSLKMTLMDEDDFLATLSHNRNNNFDEDINNFHTTEEGVHEYRRGKVLEATITEERDGKDTPTGWGIAVNKEKNTRIGWRIRITSNEHAMNNFYMLYCNVLYENIKAARQEVVMHLIVADRKSRNVQSV